VEIDSQEDQEDQEGGNRFTGRSGRKSSAFTLSTLPRAQARISETAYTATPQTRKKLCPSKRHGRILDPFGVAIPVHQVLSMPFEIDGHADGTEQIIGAAIDVHRALGPGLLESTYQACLEYELVQRGVNFQKQVPLPVIYRGVQINCGYRLDLLVEGTVIVEVKSVDRLAPIHKAQMITYLKLRRCQVGLIFNFNVTSMRQGIRRITVPAPAISS
jgi:GxxExxY protein